MVAEEIKPSMTDSLSLLIAHLICHEMGLLLSPLTLQIGRNDACDLCRIRTDSVTWPASDMKEILYTLTD